MESGKYDTDRSEARRIAEEEDDVRADQNGDAATVAETGSSTGDDSGNVASEAATLQSALSAAEAKAQEHFDAFLRAKAEADNTRRRAQEDISKAHKFGIENFAESLLPVMDSLEAALGDTTSDAAKLREGVELTQKQLLSAFERNRLVAIDPAGEKFDPHRHQAIATVPAPEGTPPNQVVTVLQKGWMLADRVLRPALVTVAS
jgi:molecular chaperone GrpE